MPNLADRQPGLIYDPDTNSWTGRLQCQLCGRYMGRAYRMVAGGWESPPCPRESCKKFVTHLGVTTLAPGE
jgi:hypothetical protein